METTSAPNSTRTDLLAAAYRVLLRDGPGHLTLDAVVRETGRSKGGVLYHFPTKEALLAGVVGLVLERFDIEVERERVSAGDEEPGALVRAYLAASVRPDPDAPAVGAGLLALVAANPGLLDPVRKHGADWQARLEADGVDPVAATIVRLAADSLAMEDLFGLSPLSPALRERVLTGIAALTREESQP